MGGLTSLFVGSPSFTLACIVISVAVMAHPKRQTWALTLAEQLDARLVWDHYDALIETGLRSLEAHNPEATHHLVVQDDAVVCQDLIPALERAVEVAGDRIVCPYLGAGRPLSRHRLGQLTADADRQGAAWIQWPGTIWGVAVLYPTAHIDRIIAGYRRGVFPRYDGRVENAARNLGVGWWYTWPSLVDHRDTDENPSLAHTGWVEPGRVAYRFIGRDTSALTVDWTAGIHKA